MLGLTLLLIATLSPGRLAQASASLGVAQSFGAVSTASGTALSAAPSVATTAGDLLVAAIKDRGAKGLASVTGVHDTAGDVWVRAARISQGGQAEGEVWYSANAAGITPPGQVTVTVSTASSLAFTVVDVTGAPAAPLDVTATGAGSSTAASTGTTATTAQASEITIADIGWNAKVTPSAQSAGYTLTAIEQSNVSGDATGEQAAWRVLTATGTQSYAAKLSSSVAWTGVIATFRLNGSPPPTPTPTATATPTPTPTPTSTPTPTTTPTPTPSPSPSPGNTPIKHIVLFFQENHSFDNVLGALCAANTRATPCDGATTGLLPNGTTIPLSQTPDIVPTLDHGFQAQTTSIDGGKMDGYANLGGCNAPAYACYSSYQPSQIPNTAALATTFAISDRTFELSPVPSWGAHLELVAQTLDGFIGNNPFYNTSASPPPVGQGWGCDSNNDAYWTAPGSTTSTPEPACVPDPSLNPAQYPYGGAYRSTPVQHVDTIMDRLDAAGLSWKLYTSDYDWAICPTFADCLDTSQKLNMVAPSQFTTDAQNGTLPSFSILLPQGGNSGATSQHNGTSMAVGDNWIGAAVSAVENGPDWSSTAIFITWDDCGCFYDHVPPPVSTWGIRVPMIIVSPYAKPGFTDSTNATFGSMLAFTEATFGLAPLGPNDAAAYDYSNAFNYQQTPLAPVPMTQRPISLAEQQYLAANPPNPNDPT
ncbi:MAG: alkaline phosphatase family protein [Candidatus Dormibacteria bacterium]